MSRCAEQIINRLVRFDAPQEIHSGFNATSYWVCS